MKLELIELIGKSPAAAMRELSSIFADADDLSLCLAREKIWDIHEWENAIKASESKHTGKLVELKTERPTRNDLCPFIYLMRDNLDLWDKCHFSHGDYAIINNCICEVVKKLADLQRKEESVQEMEKFRRLHPPSKNKANNRRH